MSNSKPEWNYFTERRHLRLRNYNYAWPGAYFVTIFTHKQQSLFGAVRNSEMNLNPYGEIVKACWQDLPRHYGGVENDVFIIMPNHVHGIITLQGDKGRSGFKPDHTRPDLRDDNERAGSKPDPAKNYPLFEIIRAFKTFSSRRINECRCSPGIPVWQRSYYERIIRSEEEYIRIGEYITFNASKWAMDSENPDAKFNRTSVTNA